MNLWLLLGIPIVLAEMVSTRTRITGQNPSRMTYQTKCSIFEYPYTNITIIFFFLQIFASAYLIIKYNQPEFYSPSLNTFIYQNVAVLVFSPVGLMMYQAFYGLHYKGLSDTPSGSKEEMSYLSRAAIWGIGGAVGIAFFQIIVVSLTKVSISAFDLFLFFASTAIAEEFLFRYGLQLGMEKFLKERVFNKQSQCEVFSAIVAIIITSLMFGLYHIFVKQSIELVLAVLGTGAILGIILRLSKSIDACIIAHTIVNIIVTLATTGALGAFVFGG